MRYESLRAELFGIIEEILEGHVRKIEGQDMATDREKNFGRDERDAY